MAQASIQRRLRRLEDSKRPPEGLTIVIEYEEMLPIDERERSSIPITVRGLPDLGDVMEKADR